MKQPYMQSTTVQLGHYYLALVTALPIRTLRAFCQSAGGGITARVITFLNDESFFF